MADACNRGAQLLFIINNWVRSMMKTLAVLSDVLLCLVLCQLNCN